MKNKKIFYCEIYFVKDIIALCSAFLIIFLFLMSESFDWIFSISIGIYAFLLCVVAVVLLYFFSAVLIGLKSKLCP